MDTITRGYNPYFILGSNIFFLAVIHLFDIAYLSKWLPVHNDQLWAFYKCQEGKFGYFAHLLREIKTYKICRNRIMKHISGALKHRHLICIFNVII